MTEETIFTAALKKPDPTERAAYLDEVCAGDAALRQRIETLLASHATSGFLQTPAVQPWEEFTPREGDETRTGPGTGTGTGGDIPLDFLAPSEKPGVLGRLGHYEVQEVIGQGGMGVVLKAFDENLHRVVAVKVMAPLLATTATARQRFTREARAAAAVSHDHIVTIHAVEESHHLPYLVMQYVAGVSLQDRINQSGQLRVREVLRIGMQTASGLAAAHKQGLVHRDIKPANILLENGIERVKITDFGLARAVDDASLTQSGQVAGTPQYMSPEQGRGEAVDARSDLFSLGSVLYAMCTGRPPFRAPNTPAVLKRVCEETPTPIREINPDIPDWLCEIIAKLQAKDPAERYQTADEVANLLGQHLAQVQHPTVVPQPVASPHTSEKRVSVEKGGRVPDLRRRWVFAAAIPLVLLTGLVAAEVAGVTNCRAMVKHAFDSNGAPVEEEKPVAPPSIPKPGEGPVVSPVPPVVPVPPADSLRPFVVLGNRGEAERTFPTLTEAIDAISDTGTIEIRSHGPFATPNFGQTAKDLVIRAGHGYSPVIQLSTDEGSKPFLQSTGVIVLEGLEFHRTGSKPIGDRTGAGTGTGAIVRSNGALWMTNCRVTFRQDGKNGYPPMWALLLCGGRTGIRNCQFILRDSMLASIDFFARGEVSLEDNVIVGNGGGLGLVSRQPTLDVSIRLRHNTVSQRQALIILSILDLPDPVGDPGQPASWPIRVEASENVLDMTWGNFQSSVAFQKGKQYSKAEIEAVLSRRISWRERCNLYSRGNPALLYEGDFRRMSIGEWEKFWGFKDSGSQIGLLRGQPGALPYTPEGRLERLYDPTVFRLADGSPGKGAGEGGRDLGADVDVVGPGSAYERWKKTPAYQQWLKDTGQVK
jgi:hypothetical protein